MYLFEGIAPSMMALALHGGEKVPLVGYSQHTRELFSAR